MKLEIYHMLVMDNKMHGVVIVYMALMDELCVQLIKILLTGSYVSYISRFQVGDDE